MHRILIVGEHAKGQLKLGTAAAAGFARKICDGGRGVFDILVLGADVGAVAESACTYGAESILVADSAELIEPLADRYAHLIAAVARDRGATVVVAAASTFSKDVLPRAAALLDSGMVSDVIDVRVESGEFVFRRILYAGNMIATVMLAGAVKVLTIRAAAFAAPERAAEHSPIKPFAFDPNSLPRLISFVSREDRAAGRPDSTEARIVVSGGRALKNSEDFERLVGGLADALGAAVGSSRALVDAGITPNSLQIGQTGKVVAPELYIAVGISGAIQHTAGIKDAKVIAAINKDPEAPIFETADFSLVADIYDAVPELISKLKA